MLLKALILDNCRDMGFYLSSHMIAANLFYLCLYNFSIKLATTIPWQTVQKNNQVLGHLSCYYSNKKANLPIRDVCKRWDQKSDPNIETMTYGLFSTCMPPGRKNIVERGDSYLFFLTSWKNGRVITGYYELGHYIDTGIPARNSKRPWKFPDYALKAKRVHFVREGIKLEKLPGRTFSPVGKSVKSDGSLSGFGPRGYVKLNEEQTLSIRDALDKKPDITHEYIAEIRRLEKINEELTTYKYPIWRMKEGFSEDLFPGYIQNGQKT